VNAAPEGPYPPTNELVAQAWLSQRVVGVSPGQVATTLPKDTAAWADAGFIQVQALPGGSVDIDTYIRHPVVQLDFYATRPNSDKPPWNLANRLVELVRIATEDAQEYGKPVDLPPDYMAARVLAVYPIGEPTRVTDDPSGYARFTLDLAVDWVRQ
jgi:hypothetical protein